MSNFIGIILCLLIVLGCSEAENEGVKVLDPVDTGQGINGDDDDDDTGNGTSGDSEDDSLGDDDDGTTSNGDGDDGTTPTEDGDDGMSADDDAPDIGCSAKPYTVEIDPINMMILLDRSQSMFETSYKEQTFEEITDQALSKLVTDERNDLVYFGLAAFPAEDCVAKELFPEADEQCYPTQEWIVEIGEDQGKNISDALDDLGTCGGTPICDSLEWAKEQLKDLDDKLSKNQTFVLLATDGAPNCSMDLDIKTCTNTGTDDIQHSAQCLDDKCSVDAAQALYDEGNELFVVGVGEGVTEWEDVLDSIADKGSDGKRKYFSASGDPADLSKVFNDIIAEATPCTFEIDWDDIDGKLGSVKACDLVVLKEEVAVDGEDDDGDDDDSGDGDDDDSKEDDDSGGIEEVEISFSEGCDSGKGWHWANDPDINYETRTDLDSCKTVELCPDTCERLKNRDLKKVKFWFGCAPVPI